MAGRWRRVLGTPRFVSAMWLATAVAATSELSNCWPGTIPTHCNSRRRLCSEAAAESARDRHCIEEQREA